MIGLTSSLVGLVVPASLASSRNDSGTEKTDKGWLPIFISKSRSYFLMGLSPGGGVVVML